MKFAGFSEMGLNSYVFDVLATHCKRPTGGGRMLVAGYPDCLVDADTLVKHLGRADFKADPRSESLKEGHGEPMLDYCRDPQAVFAALGYDSLMTVIDIQKEQGCETIVDLNEPQQLPLFDLVLDHGTIEHCFNIAQAARNLATAVGPGGFLVQHLPLNYFNHGFYNLNPNWFIDFYETNGFDILHFEGWCWTTKQTFPVPPRDEFTDPPSFSLLTCVAHRGKMQEIRWPIQWDYR